RAVPVRGEVAGEEVVDRLAPVRLLHLELPVGVAADRRPRVRAVFQPVQDAGQYRGGGQVGIGVGPGDAVLDAGVGRVAVRNAQGHGAVVEAPAVVERDEGVGHEAAVAVG